MNAIKESKKKRVNKEEQERKREIENRRYGLKEQYKMIGHMCWEKLN